MYSLIRLWLEGRSQLCTGRKEKGPGFGPHGQRQRHARSNQHHRARKPTVLYYQFLCKSDQGYVASGIQFLVQSAPDIETVCIMVCIKKLLLPIIYSSFFSDSCGSPAGGFVSLGAGAFPFASPSPSPSSSSPDSEVSSCFSSGV